MICKTSYDDVIGSKYVTCYMSAVVCVLCTVTRQMMLPETVKTQDRQCHLRESGQLLSDESGQEVNSSRQTILSERVGTGSQPS